MSNKVTIAKLQTGVPGLDEALGGGLPELSFNLIAGAPGSGKTMMAHQFVFRNATEERKAIYFTVFGEPPIKMMRYQQQFEFYDASKINKVIRFVHLGQDMVDGGLTQVLARIRNEIEAADARIVVVDSFRSVARAADAQPHPMGLDAFVQLLALMLTSHEATTFLVGEYLEQEANSNPVFTVADGIFWLYQTVIRNSMTRRLQVAKVRGQAQVPGLHTVRLSDQGMRVFPRLPLSPELYPNDPSSLPDSPLRKTGVGGLDEMLGGGVPAGYSILVAGPAGSGKTTLAAQFVIDGVEGDGGGEPAVVAIFGQRSREYLQRSLHGATLARLIREKKVELVYIRPPDLSIDETLEHLREAVQRLDAKRVVIDSLSAFEVALAPPFREDLRESLYRMVGAITGLGVTVMLTAEVTDSFTELRLNLEGVSFLTDGIILQRYFEAAGRLRRMTTVVKLRGRPHSTDLREYELGDGGIVVGPRLDGYRGVLKGVPLTLGSSAGAGKRATSGDSKRPRSRRRR